MDYKNKKIAVIGVTNREDKFGFKIFRDLLKFGYKVKGVNPQNGEVLGNKIYKNLEDIEEAPDVVITVVPSVVTEKIVETCRRMNIGEIWMQPGSESEAAIKKAGDYGVKVFHGVCFMIENNIW